MADTGNGASITFGTSGFTGCFTELDPSEQTRDALEDSCLATTGQKTYIPGDLVEPGELRAKFLFAADDDLPAFGAPETITVTYPLPSGASTPGTLAGSGFLVGRKPAMVRNGALMECEIRIKWDGKTDVSYTAAA